jgi:hypothetical protein
MTPWYLLPNAQMSSLCKPLLGVGEWASQPQIVPVYLVVAGVCLCGEAPRHSLDKAERDTATDTWF